jgi:1-deoxyxylulose-5-phosphate synthase
MERAYLGAGSAGGRAGDAPPGAEPPSAALGDTGIRVTRVILGCGNFGGVGSAPAFFGRGETREQAFALMDAAWEAGIETFDTADAYGGGRSETFIGEWLRTKGPDVRGRIVLSTKTFNPMDEGADHGLAPARVRRQLESSLDRLGVERVDMFLTHDWDPDVPIAETAGVLDELVAEGKIGAYGLSNVDGAQLREALGAGSFGWVQNAYSLLEREPEQEVLPLCAEHRLGFTPFSPLSGGWLTGKYRRGEAPPDGSRMTMRPEPYERLRTDAVFAALEELERRGERWLDAVSAKPPPPGLDAWPRDAAMAQLAFAWLLADPRVTAVVVGPRRAEHLAPALAALAAPLAADERAALGALFA